MILLQGLPTLADRRLNAHATLSRFVWGSDYFNGTPIEAIGLGGSVYLGGSVAGHDRDAPCSRGDARR